MIVPGPFNGSRRAIVQIEELPAWVHSLNRATKPLMYAVQGNWSESPQETRCWNKRRLTATERLALDTREMLSCEGDSEACAPWLLGFVPRFHMPIIGGWRKFVVIRPQLELGEKWYVGWVQEDNLAGLSLLPLTGHVRLLIGPSPTKFFGVDRGGCQITVHYEGGGKIGNAGIYVHEPLR